MRSPRRPTRRCTPHTLRASALPHALRASLSASATMHSASARRGTYFIFHSGPFAPYYSQQSPRYRYARDNTTKQMFATTRNNPDRSLVEARRRERDAAPVPNPLLPWERANVRQSAESEADTQPYRAKDSAFCRRPNDEPVPGSQKLSRRAGHL